MLMTTKMRRSPQEQEGVSFKFGRLVFEAGSGFKSIPFFGVELSSTPKKGTQGKANSVCELSDALAKLRCQWQRRSPQNAQSTSLLKNDLFFVYGFLLIANSPLCCNAP